MKSYTLKELKNIHDHAIKNNLYENALIASTKNFLALLEFKELEFSDARTQEKPVQEASKITEIHLHKPPVEPKDFKTKKGFEFVQVKVVPDKKICRICKKDKPIEEFYKKKQSPNGHDNMCKLCWGSKYSIGKAPDGLLLPAIPTPAIEPLTHLQEEIENGAGASPQKIGLGIVRTSKNTQAQNDANHTAAIQNKILLCDCPEHEKIVAGAEKKYKGKNFYKDKCLEWYVNEVELGGKVEYPHETL